MVPAEQMLQPPGLKAIRSFGIAHCKSVRANRFRCATEDLEHAVAVPPWVANAMMDRLDGPPRRTAPDPTRVTTVHAGSDQQESFGWPI